MQFKYVPTTCPHCGTGCGMNLIVTDKGVTGIAPYHRSVINRGKLCNNGQSVANELAEMPRIAKPMVAGKEVALDVAIAEVKKLSGAEVLVSPRLTSETIYLANRYAKEVQKTSGAVTLTDLYQGGNAKLANISDADVILFIGDCMRKLPVTGGNALRAKDKGAKLLYAGKAQTYTSVQADEVAVLNDAFEIPAGFTEALKGAKAGVVVTTAGNKFVADAEKYAKSVNAKFAVLYTTNNGKGTLALGCKDVRADWEKTVPKTAIVFTDAISGDEKFFQKVAPILEKIENLVVVTPALTSFSEKAKVVLPIAAFTEYDGSFVNWEGKVQMVRAAVQAPEGLITPYEMISKLSDGKIAFKDAAAIFDEIKAKVPAFKDTTLEVNGSYIKEA